ncbi:aminotransferase class I/II-fold pyridoxal phosphate-dependent enzyme [Staphylospora marina]|uniref:aminotransferase class I/II-fold pyridoxal phosphate-dependent enzyme n=1 Tax=Staphylospora marina TaxID=2490858 RepID=UPI000F5BE4EE|nr:aminotransferase class I/II-fold pyridoxal phosphate-dependent enzyme [Staphylospora marina]
MNQEQAPLFEALLAHVERVRGNFHVPGHKQGKVFDARAFSYFGSLLPLDLTEVGNLDDLHDPRGVIADAERLAAECFRADRTFFLVGGSTAGNLAAILHVCRPGDVLIVQRSSHQSVIHGLMLAGAKPVWIRGDWDERGLERPLDPRKLEDLLRRHPEAKGVFVTSPSYFGMVQPVDELAAVCHRHGIPLMVDEAHGAHFGFHPRLPESAMDSGADVAIQSTHKMLPAMTMASMMHVRGPLVDPEGLARCLRMIQSSSPSYPLMASLDLARREMALHGKDRSHRLLERLDHFRGNIQALRQVEEVRFPGPQDPLKCAVRARNGIPGFRMAELLEERGIFAELADHEKVLFAFSTGTDDASLQILERELRRLDVLLANQPVGSRRVPSLPELPEQADVSMEALRTGSRRRVPLREAVGTVSAEMIVPYPPGIPVVLPGERFSDATVRYLTELLRAGGKIRGIRTDSGISVDVLDQKTFSPEVEGP